MKIEMKTLQAGPKGIRRPGNVYTVPDAEAKALIENGYAVEVKEAKEPEPEVERAVAPPEYEVETGKAAAKAAPKKKPAAKK